MLEARFVTLLFILSLGVAGCASSPPIEEYTIARTALRAAQESDAARYASGFWHNAEQHYRKGQKLFRLNDFALAKEHFDKAIDYAEKAENVTRLKKYQSGEGLP